MLMDFAEKKERELARELNENPSVDRRRKIAQELELLRNVEKMSMEERIQRKKQLGMELKSPDFTPEKGKRIYRELEILRQGNLRL